MTSSFKIGDEVRYLNSIEPYIVVDLDGNFITKLKHKKSGFAYKGAWMFKDFKLITSPVKKPYEDIIRKIKYLDEKFDRRHEERDYEF